MMICDHTSWLHTCLMRNLHVYIMTHTWSISVLISTCVFDVCLVRDALRTLISHHALGQRDSSHTMYTHKHSFLSQAGFLKQRSGVCIYLSVTGQCWLQTNLNTFSSNQTWKTWTSLNPLKKTQRIKTEGILLSHWLTGVYHLRWTSGDVSRIIFIYFEQLSLTNKESAKTLRTKRCSLISWSPAFLIYMLTHVPDRKDLVYCNCVILLSHYSFFRVLLTHLDSFLSGHTRLSRKSLKHTNASRVYMIRTSSCSALQSGWSD